MKPFCRGSSSFLVLVAVLAHLFFHFRRVFASLFILFLHASTHAILQQVQTNIHGNGKKCFELYVSVCVKQLSIRHTLLSSVAKPDDIYGQISGGSCICDGIYKENKNERKKTFQLVCMQIKDTHSFPIAPIPFVCSVCFSHAHFTVAAHISATH